MDGIKIDVGWCYLTDFKIDRDLLVIDTMWKTGGEYRHRVDGEMKEYGSSDEIITIHHPAELIHSLKLDIGPYLYHNKMVIPAHYNTLAKVIIWEPCRWYYGS